MNKRSSVISALQLVENIHCYATSNVIPNHTDSHCHESQLTRPVDETWKEKIKEMKVKYFSNCSGLK